MEASKPARVLAIDAFRGLTILVMVFVNTLAGVRGMPAWLEHAPASVDGMTFPDLVFPAFLFIVGMSIPFAIAQRIAVGDGGWRLWRHVLSRSIGLLVLGVFMVNAEDGFNEQAMGMSIHVWSLLFYACVAAVWAVYPYNWRAVATPVRVLGAAGLLALAWCYRSGVAGDGHLAPQWWGILGLIGWAYFYASVAYRLCRGQIGWLLLLVLGLIGYYCLAHGVADFAWWAAQAENAVHTSIALTGMLTALIFFQQRRPFRVALSLAIALGLLAASLRPRFHISKIAATPSWALYSAAICVLLFAVLYWMVDLRGWHAWTRPLQAAAASPLLTYLIPYIIYAFMQSLHWSFPAVFGAGWPGLLWAAGYAVLVMALAGMLYRARIRLQL